jgi:hypothetical protein
VVDKLKDFYQGQQEEEGQEAQPAAAAATGDLDFVLGLPPAVLRALAAALDYLGAVRRSPDRAALCATLCSAAPPPLLQQPLQLGSPQTPCRAQPAKAPRTRPCTGRSNPRLPPLALHPWRRSACRACCAWWPRSGRWSPSRRCSCRPTRCASWRCGAVALAAGAARDSPRSCRRRCCSRRFNLAAPAAAQRPPTRRAPRLQVLTAGQQEGRGGGAKGSLLHLMDCTLTPFGARLLRNWVTRPLTDRALILQRLDSLDELAGRTGGGSAGEARLAPRGIAAQRPPVPPRPGCSTAPGSTCRAAPLRCTSHAGRRALPAPPPQAWPPACPCCCAGCLTWSAASRASSTAPPRPPSLWWCCRRWRRCVLARRCVYSAVAGTAGAGLGLAGSRWRGRRRPGCVGGVQLSPAEPKSGNSCSLGRQALSAAAAGPRSCEPSCEPLLTLLPTCRRWATSWACSWTRAAARSPPRASPARCWPACCSWPPAPRCLSCAAACWAP